MALNFPDSPLQGDTYVGDNGVTYTYDGDKWVGSVGGGGTADLGHLRIDSWGYPGNNPVRLTNDVYGESILVQSTDSTEPGGNQGRSSLRWHVRPEPNGQGSQYSQVDVQNDGVWIKNADWSGNDGVWYWHFDNTGNLILPQTSMNVSPAPVSLPGITFTDGTTQTTAYTGSGGSLDPYVTIVNGEVAVTTALNFVTSNAPGVITTLEGGENFNVVFYAATGDTDGNMYVLGRSNENNNYPIVYAFAPNGTLIWKQAVSMNDQLYPGYLNGIKLQGDYLYLGGTYNTTQNNNPENHFYVKLNKSDGSVNFDVVLRTPDNTYPDLYDIDVDTNGNVLMALRYNDQTALLTNVPVLGGGQNYVYVNNSNLQGYPSQSGYGGQWKVETSEGVFENADHINHVIVSPQNTTNLSASGMVVAFRYDQNQSNYWGGEVLESGSGYSQGDSMKVPGSQMLGVDGGTTLYPVYNSFNTSSGHLVVWFSMNTYPDLFSQLVNCDWVADVDGTVSYGILSVSIQGDNVQVDIDTSATPISTSVSFYTNNGNDATWTYNGGVLSNLVGRPSETLKATTWLHKYNGPDWTGITSINLRTSLSSQAVIWTPNWIKSFGSNDQGEQFDDVSYDSNDNSVYACGYFWSNNNGIYHQGAVFKLSNTDGSLLWAKYVEDDTGSCDVKSVLPDGNGYVIVVGKNNNGYTLVTKLTSAGDLVWQKRQTNNNNWNNEPRGALDSSGNIYIVGSWDNGNDYVTSIQKLNSSGILVYARSFTNQQNTNMYEFDNEDCQHTSIIGDNLFWAGYTYDINDNYNIGVALKMPTDGSITGTFDRWKILNDGDAAWEDTIDYAQLFTANYTNVDPSQTTADYGRSSVSTDTGSAFVTETTLGGSAAGINGVASISFNDGTTLDTAFAGIARHSTSAGGNNITLSLAHNGKFLHYFGENGSCTIYVPSESDVSLPIGYTVTIVVDYFDGNSIYINNDTGPADAVINAVGYNPGDGNYWRINNNGQIGVYTLMKVDTDRWVLSGPDIQID